MSGQVVGCLRVPASASGAQHVALEQVLLRSGEKAKRFAATTGPAVHVRLAPAGGRPGSTVVVTGTLAAPLAHPPQHVNLCWDGCRDGLSYSGVQAHWVSATVFQASLVVPGAPWVDDGPPRVQPLVSGSYPIGVQCVTVAVMGCGLGGSQGSAPFRLTVPAPTATACRSSTCAQLRAHPATAVPGQVVRVSGFAPLVSVIGEDQPFAYQLELLPGPAAGPQVRFRTLNGKGPVAAFFGHAALRVQAPPSWAALASTVPVATISDGLSPVAADPADPSTVAWCTGATLAVRRSDGQTVDVSTAGVPAVLRQLGVDTSGDPPRCAGVAPVGPGSGSAAGALPALAAAFTVMPADQQPLVALVALFTRDGGQHWQAVPSPPGAGPLDFGDFRYQQGRLEAVFTRDPPGGAGSDATRLEVTADGGASWQPARLSCPARGPCITFGAYQFGNCAKGLARQSLLYSTDAGEVWQSPAWPTPLSACLPAQLAATASGAELLVDPGSGYPLLRSTDGGATWTDVALPSSPRADASPWSSQLLLLPDGTLLFDTQSDTGWALLHPHATAWCSVRQPQTTAVGYAPVVTIGDQLWWLGDAGNQPSAHHVGLDQITC